MEETAIRMTGVSKRYGEVTAVDGVSFSVSAGEAFGLLGPNGAGKSTTLDVLIGFAEPTEGDVVVAGHDVTESPAEARGEMGIVPEDCGVYDRLTAEEHVRLAARAKDVTVDPSRLLRLVGLDRTDWSRPAGEYSKGMAQRLRLAVALVGDPAVLVLDEPLSGLDPSGVSEITSLVSDLRDDGTAVVFSSHNLPYVEEVCGRVGILSSSEFVGVEDLSARRQQPEELAVSTSGAVDEAVAAVESMREVTSTVVRGGEVRITVTDPAAKAEAIARAQSHAQVNDVRTGIASLDDVFSLYTEQQRGRSDTSDRTDREEVTAV